MQFSACKLVCSVVTGTTLKSYSSTEFISKLPHHGRLIWTSVALKNIPQTSQSATPTTTTTGTSPNEDGNWDLCTGLVLERIPVITKDMSPLEKRYSDFLKTFEVELSKKADHEIRHENDKKLLEQIKKGEVDQGNVQTALDFEDACTKEANLFQPASRKTEADKKNDTKSLERALNSHLLLVVSQKLGKDFKWVVPHLKRTNESSLREVADKVVSNICPTTKVRVLGNAPWAFYKYKYPVGTVDTEGKTLTGAKVFFYKAQILPGQMEFAIEKSNTIQDYNWLTRSELPTYFTKEYFHVLSDILIPEFS